MKYLSILKHINSHTLSPKRLLNRFSLIKNYRKMNAVINAFPVVLQIEVTSICNLSCIMCPGSKLTRPRQNMDIGLFEKIIKEAEGKSELAILHLMGEPLVHPDLDKMIKICERANIKTVISTNAMLLNEKRQEELSNSGLDTIILSFDGAKPETLEKIRLGAKYEIIRRNIEQFLKRKNRPHAVVQMISFDLNIQEQDKFQKMWKKYNADVLIKPYTKWQGDQGKINLWNKADSSHLEHKVCDRLWRWITIIQDGTVIPCCRDYDASIQFENLKNNSISEIWNNDSFKKFRLNHLLGRSKCSICKKCDYNPIIYDNLVAQIGTTLFDSYSILRLMYDLNYQIEE